MSRRQDFKTSKSYELLMTSYELEGNFDSKDLQDIKTSKSYVLLMTSYELGPTLIRKILSRLILQKVTSY